MNVSLSPFAPENLVSRERFGRPVPRQPALHTQAESGVCSWNHSDSLGGIHLFISPYAIGSVPSLSGQAIAYRWRSLPRVPRHRARNEYCLCIIMDQSMCAFIFRHPLLVWREHIKNNATPVAPVAQRYLVTL